MSAAKGNKDNEPLWEIADTIHTSQEIDWQSLASTIPPERRPLFERLKQIASIIDAHEERLQRVDDVVNRPTDAPPAPKPGSWGPLDIFEQIGEGAFGTVYRARDRRLNRLVALKFFRPERMSLAASSAEFVEEGRLLAMVQHPNVVTVYGAEELDGRIGIWMELIAGVTLEEILAQQGRLNAEEAMAIGRDICRALTALHESGVIHRDIKARNVMRNESGRVVLMDLGVSCEVDRQTPVTQYGTPLYAAPEVLLANKATRRSDLYSMGALLFHLVTDMYPVSGQTLADLRQAHATGTYRHLQTMLPELPDTFVRIVEQAMAPDPEQRFASANEMEQALAWALGELAEQRAAAGGDLASLAVLPFDDLSPQKELGYLCEGLAEELIGALVKLEGLKVAAHTSTFRLKAAGHDLRQIGQRLRVDNVLEGSVRTAGEQVRITARLSSVADGFPFWTEKFDGRLDDIFTLQEEIAGAIVDNLKVELLADRPQQLVKRYTDDLQAHDLFLQGRYYWTRRYDKGLPKALECFQQAIARDPGFPLAYIGVADCLTRLSYFEFMPAREGFPQAKEAAQRALASDDSIGAAHATLGWIAFFYDWDFEAAERRLRRSIELSSKWATAHFYYSNLLTALGRFDEALEQARSAAALDPYSPSTATGEGVTLYLARRNDEAIASLSRVVANHPELMIARIQLAQAYCYNGQYEEAERYLQQALTAYEFPYPLRVLGFSYALAGKHDKARAVVERLEALAQERHVSAHNFALLYYALGRTDEAFEHLERAYEERDPTLVWMKVGMEFDRMRSEPQGRRILENIGLPASDP